MLTHLNEESILFLDIETVPQHADYSQVDETFQVLWEHKSKAFCKENQTAGEVYERAGIFAEFGKIVCISVGILAKGKLRLKSFYGDDERQLLIEFSQLLNRSFSGDKHYLCSHNGKEFDYPFIARRMLIHGLSLPTILDIAGKKPWENRHLDTMELWRFGDYKHYTSLELLAAVFNIPTPKDDIRGSDVAKVYWQEKDLQRIVTYCQKDVLTVVQLFLRYKNQSIIEPENIIIT